jgi:DNA repair protein RadD
MIELRDYQTAALANVREAYRVGCRAPLLVAPTGSGKTTVFSFAASQAAAKGNRTLILAHRAELLRQTSATLDRFGVEHGLIVPGAEMTASLVQVASVQTLTRRLGRLTWAPNLIVVDEAHHCTRATGHGAILAHYSEARILGCPANPARLDGQGLGVAVGGFFDAMVLGPTVRELVEQGHLSRPVVFAPPGRPDLSSIRTLAGDFDKGALAEAVDKPAITGNCVEHYRRLAAGAPAIAFCVSVAHAENVAEAFRLAGYQAASIDGTLSDTNRRQRIEDLGAGRLNVLTSCEIISEGTDVPIVAAALLLRPTQSLGLYLQQAGRALRAYPGKERALILDHVGNVHRHGLPDADREWSLASVKARQAKPKRPSIRECPACYATHNPAPCCPCCGFRYPVQAREVEEVAGELTEIQRTAARLIARREQGQAQTLDDLRALASRRGYRPGCAERVHQARQGRPPAPRTWRGL